MEIHGYYAFVLSCIILVTKVHQAFLFIYLFPNQQEHTMQPTTTTTPPERQNDSIAPTSPGHKRTFHDAMLAMKHEEESRDAFSRTSKIARLSRAKLSISMRVLQISSAMVKPASERTYTSTHSIQMGHSSAQVIQEEVHVTAEEMLASDFVLVEPIDAIAYMVSAKQPGGPQVWLDETHRHLCARFPSILRAHEQQKCYVFEVAPSSAVMQEPSWPLVRYMMDHFFFLRIGERLTLLNSHPSLYAASLELRRQTFRRMAIDHLTSLQLATAHARLNERFERVQRLMAVARTNGASTTLDPKETNTMIHLTDILCMLMHEPLKRVLKRRQLSLLPAPIREKGLVTR